MFCVPTPARVKRVPTTIKSISCARSGSRRRDSPGARQPCPGIHHDLLQFGQCDLFQRKCDHLLVALKEGVVGMKFDCQPSSVTSGTCPPPTADMLFTAEQLLRHCLNLRTICSAYIKRHPQLEWRRVSKEVDQQAAAIMSELHATITQHGQQARRFHQVGSVLQSWPEHPQLASLFLRETEALQAAHVQSTDPAQVAIRQAQAACMQLATSPFVLLLPTSTQPRHLSRADLWDLLRSCPDPALRKHAFAVTSAVRARELAGRLSKLARARHTAVVKHGSRSWAHEQLQESVVGSPEAALVFLGRLLEALQPAVRKQAARLAGPGQKLQAWNMEYLQCQHCLAAAAGGEVAGMPGGWVDALLPELPPGGGVRGFAGANAAAAAAAAAQGGAKQQGGAAGDLGWERDAAGDLGWEGEAAGGLEGNGEAACDLGWAGVAHYFSESACLRALGRILRSMGLDLREEQVAPGERWLEGVRKLGLFLEGEGLLGYVYLTSGQGHATRLIFGRRGAPASTAGAPATDAVLGEPEHTSWGAEGGGAGEPGVVLAGVWRGGGSVLEGPMSLRVVFHEMGHALDFLLAHQDPPLRQQLDPLDFAELPSQLLERFLLDARVVQLISSCSGVKGGVGLGLGTCERLCRIWWGGVDGPLAADQEVRAAIADLLAHSPPVMAALLKAGGGGWGAGVMGGANLHAALEIGAVEGDEGDLRGVALAPLALEMGNAGAVWGPGRVRGGEEGGNVEAGAPFEKVLMSAWQLSQADRMVGGGVCDYGFLYSRCVAAAVWERHLSRDPLCEEKGRMLRDVLYDRMRGRGVREVVGDLLGWGTEGAAEGPEWVDCGAYVRVVEGFL